MPEHDRYVAMFDGFFRSSAMSSTHKPVFVRALADIGKYDQGDLIGRQWIHHNGARVRLDLDFVAARFAKYYWDMEAAFQMRHTPERMADHNNPKHDIVMIKLIRAQERQSRKDMLKKTIDGIDDHVIGDSHSVAEKVRSVLEQIKPPTLGKLASDSMGEFRKKVIDQAMQEVLDHLRTDMPDLYSWNGERYIEFDFELIGFMRDSANMVKKASCYLLARKLEQINPSARLVATMINDGEDIEKTLEEMHRLSAKILPDPLRMIVKAEKTELAQSRDVGVLIKQE